MLLSSIAFRSMAWREGGACNRLITLELRRVWSFDRRVLAQPVARRPASPLNVLYSTNKLYNISFHFFTLVIIIFHWLGRPQLLATRNLNYIPLSLYFWACLLLNNHQVGYMTVKETKLRKKKWLDPKLRSTKSVSSASNPTTSQRVHIIKIIFSNTNDNYTKFNL